MHESQWQTFDVCTTHLHLHFLHGFSRACRCLVGGIRPQEFRQMAKWTANGTQRTCGRPIAGREAQAVEAASASASTDGGGGQEIEKKNIRAAQWTTVIRCSSRCEDFGKLGKSSMVKKPASARRKRRQNRLYVTIHVKVLVIRVTSHGFHKPPLQRFSPTPGLSSVKALIE